MPFEERFLEEHPFCEGGGLLLQNEMIIHFSEAFNPPSVHTFFYS